jgi:hypothetical protein
MSLNKTMAALQIGIKLMTVDQDAVQCRYSALFRKQVIQHIRSLKKIMLHLEIRDSRSLHYRNEKGATGTT